MSNKKNSKKKKAEFPFTNHEMKEMKNDFKKMIDDMSNENFFDLVSFLMFSSDAFEDGLFDDECPFEYFEDEELDDELDDFCNTEKSNICFFPTVENDDLPF